jgi:hypothetical protein
MIEEARVKVDAYRPNVVNIEVEKSYPRIPNPDDPLSIRAWKWILTTSSCVGAYKAVAHSPRFGAAGLIISTAALLIRPPTTHFTRSESRLFSESGKPGGKISDEISSLEHLLDSNTGKERRLCDFMGSAAIFYLFMVTLPYSSKIVPLVLTYFGSRNVCVMLQPDQLVKKLF